jgi:hypothetical protein
MAAQEASGAVRCGSVGVSSLGTRPAQGSNQLKAEGNQLHNRGAYAEAAEKYERAKSNLAGMGEREAVDLVRACTLNLSSCYLNLGRFAECLEQCDTVLSSERGRRA